MNGVARLDKIRPHSACQYLARRGQHSIRVKTKNAVVFNYLQELEEILGRTVMVKSDPLLHQEKFDLA